MKFFNNFKHYHKHTKIILGLYTINLAFIVTNAMVKKEISSPSILYSMYCVLGITQTIGYANNAIQLENEINAPELRMAI